MSKRTLIILSVLSGASAFGFMWWWAWMEHYQPEGKFWWGWFPSVFTCLGLLVATILLAIRASEKQEADHD